MALGEDDLPPVSTFPAISFPWELSIWLLQQLLDDFLIFLLVARCESYLRVADDAPGVNDVRRSAEAVTLAQIRAPAKKHGKGNAEFLVEFPHFLTVGKHRNRKHLQTVLGEPLVQLLEMHHLLPRERSVAGEKSRWPLWDG
jgi:hypothetical protein